MVCAFIALYLMHPRLSMHYKHKNTRQTKFLWFCKVKGNARSFFCGMKLIDQDVSETDLQLLDCI